MDAPTKNVFRTLRDYFGRHSCPTETKIEKHVHKLKQIGSVAHLKTALTAFVRRPDEKLPALQERVTKQPNTSVHHCMQELGLPTIMLH